MKRVLLTGMSGTGKSTVIEELAARGYSVRLVYRYDDLSRYDEHEVRAMTDQQYGKLAAAMGFVDGTIAYTVYRQI